MSWEEAVKHYENRLGVALDVHRHAFHLTKVAHSDVPDRLKTQLKEVSEPAKRQLSRLKRREFRIAVVGLEKAGKSTFINAWLEKDLLPNDDPRCTFSTTEIHSVKNDRDQRLEVKVKSYDKFKSFEEELRLKSVGDSDSAKRAQKDLETMQVNRKTLET